MFERTLEGLEQELRMVVPDAQKAILQRQMPEADREELLSQLTNGQTYFFRHPDQCQAFEEYLRGTELQKTFRIWSAGCSTGCEPYTIAMMLDKTRRQGRVVGTDISRERLRQAEQGVYRESRMLRLNLAERDRYFAAHGSGQWQIRPWLKASVQFHQENLNESNGPGMARYWDVIFCRNVLIYFDEAGAREILGRMVERLETGGVLVLGYPEAFFGLQHPELVLMAARTAIFTKVPRVEESALQPLAPTLPVASHPGAFQEGLRLHAMGRLAEARQQFLEAEVNEPGMALVHYFSARLHDELKETDSAVASLRKFFQNYRDDDPEVLDFTRRNGLSLEQLNQAATRLRERLEQHER